MKNDRPRLLIDSPDWPEELVGQRKQLARKATWRWWAPVLYIVGINGVAVSTVLQYLNGPMWVRAVMFALMGGANAFFIGRVLRRRTRDDVARLLIDNGYCVCGYPFQVQGIVRSCPECGRKWTEKALPKD